MNIHEIKQSLAPVQISLLKAFLQAHQWQNIANWTRPVSVWQKEDEQIKLPESKSLKDYYTGLWGVLQTLSKVENISLPSLIETVGGKDILKIRIIGEDVKKGRIPLTDGSKLFTGIAQLLQETIKKSANQLKTLNKEQKKEWAQHYLQQIELGQTEIGSYAVNIITPPASVECADWVSENNFFQKNLHDGLQHLLTCIKEMQHENDIFPFIRHEESFINGKLCQTLLDMAGEKQREIEIQFLTANTSADDQLSPILILRKNWQPITLAYQYFKGAEIMQPDYTLAGDITDLHRDAAIDNNGNRQELADCVYRITILTIFNKKPRKVSIELNKDDYQKALAAHDAHQQVRCRGDLLISPRRAKMENLKVFETL